MKQILFFLGFISLLGCSMSLHRTVEVEIKGDNLKTPYGAGNGYVKYKKVTIFGPAKIDSEVSATDD